MREDAKILVRVRAFIGDSLFALPALEALRERYPDATILFAANEAAAPLFEGDPRIDRFIPLAAPGGSAKKHAGVLRDYWALLRRERPDAHLALDAGGNLLPHLVWLARAPRRLGCVGREATGRRWHRAPLWMLTDHLPTPEELGLHRAHGFLKLAGLLGADDRPRRIRLHTTPAHRERGREIMDAAGAPAGRVAAFHPGASWVDRKWPIERMAQVARALATEGVQPIALGGPGDEEDVEALVTQGGATCVPTPGVAELAWVLGAVDVLIANDSGPAHIGSALGTPVVGLYGPTVPHVVGIDPLHPRARTLYAALPCSPCAQNTVDKDARCPRPEGAWCMELIEMPEVLAAARELLRA